MHSTLDGRARDQGRRQAGTGGSKAGCYDGRVLPSRVTAPSSHNRRPLARNLAPLSHSWRTIPSEFTLVTSSFLPNPVPTHRAPDSSEWGQNAVLHSCVTSRATQEIGSSSLIKCLFPHPSQGPCRQFRVAGLGNRVSPQVGG